MVIQQRQDVFWYLPIRKVSISWSILRVFEENLIDDSISFVFTVILVVHRHPGSHQNSNVLAFESEGRVKQSLYDSTSWWEYIIKYRGSHSQLGTTGALHCSVLLIPFLDLSYLWSIFTLMLSCWFPLAIPSALGEEWKDHRPENSLNRSQICAGPVFWGTWTSRFRTDVVWFWLSLHPQQIIPLRANSNILDCVSNALISKPESSCLFR